MVVNVSAAEDLERDVDNRSDSSRRGFALEFDAEKCFSPTRFHSSFGGPNTLRFLPPILPRMRVVVCACWWLKRQRKELHNLTMTPSITGA